MRKATWASVLLTGLAWMGLAGAAHAENGVAQAKAIMARLPLAFEPSAGGRTYLSHTGSSWTRVSPTGFQVEAGRSQDAAIGMELVGTTGQGAITAEEPAGEANYLLGADTSHWRRHVPQYGRVVSRDVYCGIDLVFHGSEGRLEHDFDVAPQADYRAIRMRYTGQASLTAGGELRIKHDAGLMIVHAPVAYQEISGRHVARESHFVLAKGEVSFAIGDYDRSRPLVIDPVLDYGTYLADQDLHVAGMAVDSAGSTYITGLSFSGSYPVTAGAVQTTCASCPNKPDVFVTKLNAAGTAQVYSTFLGGSDYDESLAITVDGEGNAIVAGRTASNDFPIKNPIDSGRPTLYAGFAASLTPDGSSLNFSTILGGADAAGHGANTYIKAVATDSDGNAYVSGLSDTTTVPLTPGALDAVAPGYPTEYFFMTKLSRTGTLLYGAILGQVDPTSECCYLAKITVNAQGELLIAGTIGSDYNTGAVHWPTTPGAYQTAALVPSGASPIVAKLAADGSHFVFSTLAGAGVLRDAVVDATGATILIGDTFSPVPVTADAYLSQSAGGFLEKVSADGTRLLYASYLGDPAPTAIGTLTTSNIALDSSGNVWVEGQISGSFPVVHPLQSLLPGAPSQTGFLSEFDPAMHTLLFSTYFAGNLGSFQPAGLAFDNAGKLHLAGAGPFDMPTTSGALRETVTPPPPSYSYRFGYVGLIDPAAANPGLCVKVPVSPTAELGSSTQDSILLTNCGLAPLTISGTQLSGLGLNLPTQTACDTTIAPGDTCTLPLSFTPQITPQTAGVLTIDSNAMVKESVVPFNAVGLIASGPALNVQPQSVVFQSQQEGTTAAQQTVIVYSAGSFGSQVTISSIATTGDFSQTNTCIESLQAGRCQIQVSFTPTAGGGRTGVLTIASNAQGSPVQIPLSGQGTSVLAATPGTPSLTVASSGQSATTAIHIQSQNGFAGTAALTCNVQFQGQGTPHDLPTCSLDPTQVQLSSNGTASSTLTVNTTAASSSAVRHASFYWLAGVLLACMLPARRSLRAMSPGLVVGCALLGGLTGCGGGSSSPLAPVTTTPAPTDAGTTPGTYVVTVSATSGAASTTAQVSIVVQ